MKILHWFNEHIEELLISIAIVLISIFVFAQIIMRNVLGSALSWSDEASRYLFIWAAALGIPYTTKKSAHLRMDIIPVMLPKLARPLEILSDISLLGICILFLEPGARLMNMLARTNQLSAALQIPMYLVYFSMYLAFILTLFRIIQKYIVSILKNRRKEAC